MLIKHGQRKTLISTEKSALLKSFFSGLLLYRYRNIILIVAPYNCWKEFPYIYSEGARVQVLQRCISSGIQSWISDTKESAKLEDFLSTI